MPYDLSNVLVVGISSRALFDLEEENVLFGRDGVDAFINYQLTYSLMIRTFTAARHHV